jgi:uncharacterized membrane protein (UPF0127 family)
MAIERGASRHHDGPVNRFLVCVAWIWLAGCSREGGPSSSTGTSSVKEAPKPVEMSPVAAAEPTFYQSEALSGLPRVRLWLGTLEVKAEVCSTLTQIATGLMHRTSISTNDAMLFVFGGARDRSFYMRNVPFDIDAAYIDPEGVITEVVRLRARDEKGVPSKSQRVQFVLETAPDFLKEHGIGPGTLIQTERGPLREALGRIAQLP